MLSWEVKDGSFNDADWQQSVATIRERNKPVLLRPLINTQNPAAYRAIWQRLVTSFRASGDTTAVWVWTPPRPDSLAAYFPGAVYTDWIAADYLTSTVPATDASQQYLPLRIKLAERVEVNSKPILIITAAQPNQTPAMQAHRITQLYPEVKAVLVDADTKPHKLFSRTDSSSKL